MINKVILIGRLGGDPEKVEVTGGHNLARFSLATSESYKSGDEWKEETTWLKVSAWQGRAVFCLKHLQKGDLCYVEGKIKVREYMQGEEKRYFTEVHANVLRRLNQRTNTISGGNEEGKGGGFGDDVKVPNEPMKATKEDELGDDLPF